MSVTGSSLARWCAVVSRSMERSDPTTLLACLDGEPARAAREAASLLAGGDLDANRAPGLHTSWLTGSLHRFPDQVRPGLLRMTQPHLARLAALALEREHDGDLDTRAAARPTACTASTLMRALATIPSGANPQESPAALRTDALAYVQQLSLPQEVVFARWPEDARRILDHVGRVLPDCDDAPARSIVTLAACLVGQVGVARAVASLMTRDVGSTLLACVNRWWFVLDPVDADDLATRISGGLSWAR